ncbi:MAG: TaqI-like C-terminal specificity domain-containing protein [Bacteroidota bacterium]
MTESELKFKLQKKYDHSTWKDLLTSIFPKVEYLLHPTILAEKTDTAKLVRQIGNLAITDGNIGIFEVEVSSRKKIARNRVELRKIAASYIDQGIIHGAFVFYFASNQNDYRFTFIAKKSNLTEDGELVKYQTPPKRYTYVLGPNESCTTAAKRLLELEKNEEVTLDSIIQAFSIEKLNKEFFTKYKKEHYELFCDYLANSPYRKSVFNIPHHKDKKENAKAEKPIRDFIKLLLGRIVFLHFLQKKGWLGCPAEIEEWKDGDPKFMQNLFVNCKDKKHFHSECLTELFFDTLNNHKRKNNIFSSTNTRVPYLNGGLFDNSHSEYNDIDFPKELFENLFDFFTQYNFTIDESSPNEHEVGIDPEMLGHIFENLLEDNKDKGAFYTPKEIVHYMCHESLIQYLSTNLSPLFSRGEHKGGPEEDIQNFIHSQEVTQFIRDYAKEIDSLLDKVKICDPAIGSGAFPMGLLKEIFQAKILLYPYIKTNRSFNPGAVKRNIIQNSIYGVDIDSGAVDIARLRFWLALIVDEEEPTPLPNLDYKIMQGNSLLESFEGINLNTSFDEEKFRVTLVNNQINIFSGDVVDPQYQVNFTNQQKLEIRELTESYFKETDKAEKQKIHRKIETKVLDHIEMNLELYKNRKTIELAELKHELNIRIKGINKLSSKKQFLNKNKLLKEINQIRFELKEIKKKYTSLKALEETTERPYFLWHFYFKDVFDKGGFDIVIGNPPYISIQKLEENYKTVLEDQGFKTFEKTGDIYTLFYEVGKNLLKEKGVLTFITSRQWIHSSYGQATRKYFIEYTNPLKLVDFGKVKIFDAATVFVNIMILQNTVNQNELEGCEVKSDFDINRDRISQYFSLNQSKLAGLSENTWKIGGDEENQINLKIEQLAKPLSEIKDWDISFSRGVTSGLNEAFYIDLSTKKALLKEDSKNKEIIKPLLRGKDIKRYYYTFQNIYLINSHNGVKELDIPRIDVVKDYPTIYEHLKHFKKDLEIRQDKGDHWTNLRNCAFLEEFEKPKIVWLEISDKANYSYDDKGMYLTNSAYFLTGKNIKYILAILNSKLTDYYFFQITAKIAGGRKRYTKQYVEQVRIPEIPVEQQKPFVKLVDKILESKQKGLDTAALENEIDIMVYKLYNLTYEEVEIIDPNIEQIISKEEYEGFKIS